MNHQASSLTDFVHIESSHRVEIESLLQALTFALNQPLLLLDEHDRL